jgi:hypothetical protein
MKYALNIGLLFCYFGSDNSLEALPGTCAEHLLNIEIDIVIGPSEHLYERFEWDLTNPDNSPEEFAACLVSDYIHQYRDTTTLLSNFELV